MQVNLNIQGLEKVKKELDALSSGGLRTAVAATLNQVGYTVRKAMQTEMAAVFDRPTPYTLRSVRVSPATLDKLQAVVEPTYMGGKGVDPQKYLQAEVFGGARTYKRSEKALRSAGILPPGYYTAIPRTPFPGSDDGRGNLRGPFMVQLLSYLQAFGEQGYKANMTARRKTALAKRSVTPGGANMIGGVEYFVSYGKLRSSANGKTSPLAPGIWARSGIHGSNVRPVLMFVRQPNYKVRLDLDKIRRDTNPKALMAKWLRGNIRDQYRAQTKAAVSGVQA